MSDQIKCFLVEHDEASRESLSHPVPYWNPLTGEKYHSRFALPPGAILRQTWLEDDPEWSYRFCGEDGKSYTVILPDGTGVCFDQHASNCTKPDDYEHHCWVRHGEAPNFTLDKNGVTCGAGTGSLLGLDGWHGYLRDGYLIEC